MKYATPNPPAHQAGLIFAGGSFFGSHAVRLATTCLRSSAISNHWGRPRWPVSQQNGTVSVLVDPDGVLVHGPFEEGRTFDLAQSVWMIRGTLVHIAFAHELANLAIARDGAVVIGGKLYDATTPLYTAAEAVEAAAFIIGLQARTLALPNARKMLPQVKAWSASLIERDMVTAIETQLAWHVRAPWAYTARLDLVTTNRVSKMVRAWDYKTSSRPTADKLKYAVSAQLHGQDQMGHLWAGSRWAGVMVLLVEDVGADEGRIGVVDEWQLPRSPVGNRLEGALLQMQEVVKPWADRDPATWPANPFGCANCSYRQPCYSSPFRT